MKVFSEFLVESIDVTAFQNDAKNVKGLTFKDVRKKGVVYSFMRVFCSTLVFESTLKDFASSAGLSFRKSAMFYELKNDLCKIQVDQDDYPEIAIKLSLEPGAVKEADTKNVLKSVTGLAKALESRVKQLKEYGKLVDAFQNVLKKHKLPVGSIPIMGSFDDDGSLLDATVVPPKGHDVEYFDEDLINELQAAAKPIATKLGVKENRYGVAGGMYGNNVCDISGLSSLK